MGGHLEVWPYRPWFPVAFRPPAFASWASCSRQKELAFLTVGLPSTWLFGPHRDFHVPHGWDTAGLGAPLLRDGGALPAEIVYSAGTCRFPTASP